MQIAWQVAIDTRITSQVTALIGPERRDGMLDRNRYRTVSSTSLSNKKDSAVIDMTRGLVTR